MSDKVKENTAEIAKVFAGAVLFGVVFGTVTAIARKAADAING